MKNFLLERELRGHAAGSCRSRALEESIEEHLKKVLLERELWGDAAGSYRSRALEDAIEAEHLTKVLLDRELRGVAEGCTQRRMESGKEKEEDGGVGLTLEI